MKIINILLRIIAVPFVLALNLIVLIRKLLTSGYFFLKYGGEYAPYMIKAVNEMNWHYKRGIKYGRLEMKEEILQYVFEYAIWDGCEVGDYRKKLNKDLKKKFEDIILD